MIEIAPRLERPYGSRNPVDIEVTPAMLAAGREAPHELGLIKRPTGAHEVLVAGIYKAKARIRHGEAAVEVTVPGVLEPVAELVLKNESDQPYASLPTRGESSRCASGLSDSPGRHHDPPPTRNGHVPTAPAPAVSKGWNQAKHRLHL